MDNLLLFFRELKNAFRDLLPIILVIVFFQAVIIQALPGDVTSLILGLVIVAVGLSLFIQGLDIGIFPIGEGLAHEFARKGSFFWLMVFAFFIGFGTTIAEPALLAVAQKAEVISSGRIDADWLRIVVALSVGFAIMLGVFRIITGHPIQYYIIGGYILVVAITYFSPAEIIGLAYDSGGVTTSTVTVPLVTALGVGLASSIRGRNPVIDGFGLIAFASLTPMIFVLGYGIIVYNFLPAPEGAAQLLTTLPKAEAVEYTLSSIIWELLSVMKDVLPILGIILFFQYVIIRRPYGNLKRAVGGFGLVILGLYAFIVGLNIGLFPLGEEMAAQLTGMGNLFYIYLFGFAIGFSTTMAEPSLIAVAIKAREVSNGKINDLYLRLFVAVGVAIGIALGAYRIVEGDPLHYYIIVGYIIVIILTLFSPQYIIPIAYDSGGVTTSTVTVPLVAALGLGLASNIEGRSPLLDGFGLIAFASLFPMITVMAYEIISEKLFTLKKERES